MQKSFDQQLKIAADFFSSLENVKIISHLDTDGICAASILISALNRKRRKYTTTIVPQLDNRLIDELARDNYGSYIFTDLGSGQLEKIKEALAEKNVLILDHHNIRKAGELPKNIMHVNPHEHGIKGSTDISGAGVVLEFARKLDEKNKSLAHLAVIGAIGDCQERNGFRGYNERILKMAEDSKKIKTINGLRLFGAQTKPLHKLLQNCFEPYIPGVSGSEHGALALLKSAGIKPRIENTWKKLIHLTDEEIENLGKAIAEKVTDRNIYGSVYILPHEKEGPLRDAKEFSTVLNSCGRLGKASIGIGTCLGDPKMKKKAVKNLMEYKREIMNALSWYEEGKGVTKKKGYVIINAEFSISPSMIGTIASIISRSNKFDIGTIIVAMARQDNGMTKVSLRASRNISCMDQANLKDAITAIAQKVDGEYGGHRNAAGAIIKTSQEKEFIKAAKEHLERLVMEERVA